MATETTQGHPEGSDVPAVAPMLKIMGDVDDALLAEAQRVLGSGSASDTINWGLAQLIREGRRSQAAEAQLRRFEAGQFAGLPVAGGAR